MDAAMKNNSKNFSISPVKEEKLEETPKSDIGEK